MNVFGWLAGRGELAAGSGVVNAGTGRSSRFEKGRGDADGSRARDTLLEMQISENYSYSSLISMIFLQVDKCGQAPVKSLNA